MRKKRNRKAPKKLKVLVIFDIPGNLIKDFDLSREDENPDWKVEYHAVEALGELGHDVRTLGVFDDPGMIIDELKKHPPDIVLNLTEEFNQRSSYDRNVAGLLEMLEVPYTGTGPTGLTLCKNKGMTKEILAYHRIEHPEFAVFPLGASVRRPKHLHFPLFIKPLKDEASYGISQDSFVEDDRAFEERIRFIHERMSQGAIAEEFIEGRELYVSILGNRRLEVLPFREVIFSKVPEGRPKISTFKAKWDEGYRERWGIRNRMVRDLPENMVTRIADVCKKVYRVLHIRGCGRIDLRLTKDNRIFILEANPNPNLSFDDEVALSAEKANISYKNLIQRLLTLGLRN
ncbi:MAG TPA: ATP-grasp domain-containing protein [Nitrospiria bacterium]